MGQVGHLVNHHHPEKVEKNMYLKHLQSTSMTFAKVFNTYNVISWFTMIKFLWLFYLFIVTFFTFSLNIIINFLDIRTNGSHIYISVVVYLLFAIIIPEILRNIFSFIDVLLSIFGCDTGFETRMSFSV